MNNKEPEPEIPVSRPVVYGRRLFLKNAAALTASTLVPLFACTGKSEDISFAILSDLHFHPTNSSEFLNYRELINKLNVNFLVLNGDNINDDGPNLLGGVRIWERFDDTYKRFYSDYLAGFNNSIQIFPVLGNHDPFFPAGRNMEIMHELMDDEKFLFHHRELVKNCTGDQHNMEFYSWDEGNWHFLTIPCGGTRYLEKLGVFSWMDDDLRKNRKKPTIVYMHVPPLSIGMTDSYFIDVTQKGRYMDLFSKYGNVKYVFSGHIHNSTKVSVRAARNYKGTTYIVCPTHIYDQRPFGKNQKYSGEVEQNNHGFIVGYLKNNEAELYSVLPDSSNIDYPETFNSFSYASNPVNFFKLNELPPDDGSIIVFGDKRLQGWFTNYVYNEETNPSYVQEVSTSIKCTGKVPIHMAMKGRTNVYVDFNNVGQANNALKYFEQSGNIKDCRIKMSCFIDKFTYAETDLTKHDNPQNAEIKPGRFRYQSHYNLFYILLAFLKENQVVYQYEHQFGKMEKGPAAQGGVLNEQMKYRFSIFDYGEWIHPANKKTVIEEIPVKEWKKLEINMKDEGAPALDYDRILISVNLSNDGLIGHEMSVYFDDIEILS